MAAATAANAGPSVSVQDASKSLVAVLERIENRLQEHEKRLDYLAGKVLKLFEGKVESAEESIKEELDRQFADIQRRLLDSWKQPVWINPAPHPYPGIWMQTTLDSHGK